jgi:WD40 repeat protein
MEHKEKYLDIKSNRDSRLSRESIESQSKRYSEGDIFNPVEIKRTHPSIREKFNSFKEKLNKTLEEIFSNIVQENCNKENINLIFSSEPDLLPILKKIEILFKQEMETLINLSIPEFNELKVSHKKDNFAKKIEESTKSNYNNIFVENTISKNMTIAPQLKFFLGQNQISVPSQKILPPPKVSFLKSIPNHTGGMFFHPRELINDEILLTGGRDGLIKFWDIKNYKINLINQVDIGVQWITSLKHDSKYSHIYCSTYSKFLFIFDYQVKTNQVTHLKTFQMEGLNFIYGFDVLNNDTFSLLACSGYPEMSESVFIYQNTSNYNADYVLLQAIVPLQQVDYITNKSKENYSKSLKFFKNFLIIGLQNGIIEVYKLDECTKIAEFIYHINLSMPDWVYQIKIIKKEERNLILASNANCFYCVEISENDYKIHTKKNFLGSIHDFCYVVSKIEINYTNCDILNTEENFDDHSIEKNSSFTYNCELMFFKLKTGLVIIYDFINDKILQEIDESKKRGLYDHCLIASQKEKLLFSCRDNDILIYKY